MNRNEASIAENSVSLAKGLFHKFDPDKDLAHFVKNKNLYTLTQGQACFPSRDRVMSVGGRPGGGFQALEYQVQRGLYQKDPGEWVPHLNDGSDDGSTQPRVTPKKALPFCPFCLILKRSSWD